MGQISFFGTTANIHMPCAGIKTWAFSGPHSHSCEWEDPEQASRCKTELTTTRHPPASAQSPALGGISPGVRERSDWKQSWEDKPAGCTGQGLSAPRCKAWCWRVLWGRRGKILLGLEKERQEERVREVRKREEGSKGERGTDDQVQERPLVSVCKCAFV